VSRPTVPLRQFVLKVHSRCDLACDHCYVYQASDQSWRGRPQAMSDETISWSAGRIAEHAKTHRLPAVHVVLHGGEPLLAGPARLRLAAETLRSALDGVSDLDLRIHTNGVLLDEGFCDLFAACGIKVGVSVDGYRAANDRHRRYADGRSSYDRVIRAIGLLRTERYRPLYAGLLCTIDVANDPVAVYESLLELDPPRIDFLLPHATWDAPPARPRVEAGYGNWLIAIFERWAAGGRPVPIRTFDSIIQTSDGGASLTEALGLGPSDLAVIETDGSYEQADSLKVAFEGAPATGLDVFRHPVDLVAQHPAMVARQRGLAGLCATCRACPVVSSCGGGLYAHRYRSGTGFDNPSVFCPDLLKLITHIRRRTRRAVRAGPAHALPAAEFATLAAGLGGARAIGNLAQAQRSMRRALVTAVHQAAGAAGVPGSDALNLQASWDLLTRIDRDNPRVLARVLGHPYVRVWAVRCLDQLKSATGRARGAVGLAADLGHLGAIAATTAIRSGVEANITVPVLAGAVHLPTLGRLDVGDARSSPEPDGDTAPLDTATVEAGHGAVTVRTKDLQCRLDRSELLTRRARAGAAPGRWQPVRRLTAPGISVTLEDTDPYRDCHQWTAAPRLADAELAEWQRLFRGAWAEIGRTHGTYADGLAAGLCTVMPLSAGPPGRDVSATARNAFGAVAAALPASPVTLALLLIHEFQHVKLGAVLDVFDLYDPDDDRLFPAPWRDDPRPLEGLLQGTYAHLAVTDFWRAQRNAADGPDAEAADARFVRWRAHTADAIEMLAASGSLTPLGINFIDSMRDSITTLLDE
jgi:uncharacterized protein